ncbi:MAG: polyprenyl synthetase family protein [Bacteroidota bacterium]
MHATEELRQKLTQRISQLQYGENPHNLYEPIRYIMSLGGKRLRPLLVLLSYQLRGAKVDDIVDIALAVEVFHNFTLMHDDIMDEAPLRRGQPTVHEKWNDTVAILSGDTMLIKAYDLLLQSPPPMLHKVISLFNKTAVEVCEGQQIDMNFESESTVSEADYIEMIRLKTAVLLGYSLQLGGLLSGSDDDNQSKLYEVGEKMGIGFQLMDDYLDVYADQSKFGKQVGGDIIANKKTYLLITALEMATGEARELLEDWLHRQDFDPAAKVAGVRQIYDDIGIPNLIQLKMNYYFDQAFEGIESVEGSPAGKEVLRTFANQLMKRDK